MEVNSISTSTSSAYTTTNDTTTTASTTTATETTTEETTANSNGAAVYEPSTDTEESTTSTTSYKTDYDKVESMKLEMAQKQQQMQNLVVTALLNQGSKEVTSSLYMNEDGSLTSTSVENILTKDFMSAVEPDEATIAAAQADVSEDGYWGVDQTSDRLVDFAVALSGGDPDKIELLREAITKGFEQAEAAWGDELPEISQQTFDATMQKLDDWLANGLA